MSTDTAAASASRRFAEYCDLLDGAIGHADRAAPLRAYLSGLLLAGDRKSVEPMAARIDPRHVSARHQSMHHFVACARWEDSVVLEAARDRVLRAMEAHSPVSAWIVDDTGIPKKGKLSVGVAHQYCGVLGKTANCQVAVSISVANALTSVPCSWRLYLPKEWAEDRRRREAAGVPEEVEFAEKWRIAVDEIDLLLAADLPRAPVLADAGYGVATGFRDALRERSLLYAVGIREDVTVWAKGTGPCPAPPKGALGRPPKLLGRDEDHRPLTVKALAGQLAVREWKSVRWREGTRGALRSRFARVRVHAAHRDNLRSEIRPEEWLVIEWPKDQEQPTKYFLSSLPESASLEHLVSLIKLRWRIERDYQVLKSEIGLDHYEGRGWRGFHHHGVLSIAAYAFLAAERARLPPPQPVAFLKAARIPKSFKPRGSPSAA